MVTLSTHKSFALAAKKAKALAVKSAQLITIKPIVTTNGVTKYQVRGGAL